MIRWLRNRLTEHRKARFIAAILEKLRTHAATMPEPLAGNPPVRFVPGRARLDRPRGPQPRDPGMCVYPPRRAQVDAPARDVR